MTIVHQQGADMSDQQPTAGTQQQIEVTAHQMQVAMLLDQVAQQARQHAEEMSVVKVNHAIEVQALKAALAADGRVAEDAAS